MSHQFHPTTLREYDIRGVIGETKQGQIANNQKARETD